jgi:probable rRNA maturation factor
VVSVNNVAWTRSCREIETVCRHAVDAARGAGVTAARAPVGEVGIILSDDATVRGLNRDYRGKDQATNVLSFATNSPPIPGLRHPLGDIVLGFSTVQAESRRFGRSLEHHVQHLVVHGYLHLLGFDHETAEDAETMEALETRILAGLGVADPYAERAVDHSTDPGGDPGAEPWVDPPTGRRAPTDPGTRAAQGAER